MPKCPQCNESKNVRALNKTMTGERYWCGNCRIDFLIRKRPKTR
jgi:transposase-like protein